MTLKYVETNGHFSISIFATNDVGLSKASNNGRKYSGEYTRAIYIPKEIAEEYRQCFDEVINVLAKHAKKFEVNE